MTVFRIVDESVRLPVLSLSADCRYDKMCEALGGRGWLVKSKQEIANALKEVSTPRKMLTYNLSFSKWERQEIIESQKNELVHR